MVDATPNQSLLSLLHAFYSVRRDLTSIDEDQMQCVPFRSVVGSVLSLASRTRSYIATAKSNLKKFQFILRLEHWKALKNAVRYLKGTIDYGVLYTYGKGKTTVEA